jgi:hypothetical protein
MGKKNIFKKRVEPPIFYFKNLFLNFNVILFFVFLTPFVFFIKLKKKGKFKY